MPFHILTQRRPPIIEKPLPPPEVGKLLCGVAPLGREDSLGKALYQLQRYHVTALPVVNEGKVIGWMSEEQLAELLLNDAGAEHGVQVGAVMEPVPALLETGDALAHALAVFHATGAAILPVVWVNGFYQGCLTRTAALLARDGKIVPPPRVGGMATPLGVYLTNGVVNGGVGHIGLLLTGVVMALLLWIAQTLVAFLAALGFHLTHVAFLRDIFIMLAKDNFTGSPTLELLVTIASSAVLITVYLLFLRIVPKMTGFHAAEHQTVHAIEAGETLTPAAVARMPRAHPRCGTNLWGLVMLTYLALAVLSLVLSTPLGRENLSTVVPFAIVAVLGIAANWRRVGAWLQDHFTTRPATPAEIASGIRAGKEVLYRHLTTPYQPPRLGQRLLSMGLLQVFVGIMLMGTLLQLLNGQLDFLWAFLVK